MRGAKRGGFPPPFQIPTATLWPQEPILLPVHQCQPASLYFSHTDNQPRALVSPRCLAGEVVMPESPGQVTAQALWWARLEGSSTGEGQGHRNVYQKEEQLSNIHSWVCHAFFFT